MREDNTRETNRLIFSFCVISQVVIDKSGTTMVLEAASTTNLKKGRAGKHKTKKSGSLKYAYRGD